MVELSVECSFSQLFSATSLTGLKVNKLRLDYFDRQVPHFHYPVCVYFQAGLFHTEL